MSESESTLAADTQRWLAVQEEAHELTREHPGWRWGQALFNALHGIDPALANQIRGTVADPFHDATRVPEFMDAVMGGLATPTAAHVEAGGEWLTCPGCSQDVLADELCACDAEDGPKCLARCCKRDHPVGRKPWEGDAA